jgi:hypothetical protein
MRRHRVRVFVSDTVAIVAPPRCDVCYFGEEYFFFVVDGALACKKALSDDQER